MAENFENLEIWKEAHQLALLVYKVTGTFPKEETYGLTDQLRRATVSIVANIVEGYERHHFADQINFFINARGSDAEV